MFNSPLYNHLTQRRALELSWFHMPGHKNALPELQALWSFDYTDSVPEVMPGLSQAERLATEYFGTTSTLFSAGGCTLCVQAMFRLAVPSGGTIICARTSHISAVNAMALLGIAPVWISSDSSSGPSFPGRITANGIKSALLMHPEASAVYITSPDYYGVISNIAAIAKVCKCHNVPLLVDNAHGSHFFCINPNEHPINLGASLCSDSAHKTLPVLTGGAFLHINNTYYAENAPCAIKFFASSSPSIPILASLDLCRAWMQEHGKEAFLLLSERVKKVKFLAKKMGIILPEGPCDSARIAFDMSPLGWEGRSLFDFFRKCGIDPEFVSGSHVVMIPSPMNTSEDFLRLERAISSIAAKEPIKSKPFENILCEQCMPLREAVFSKSKWLPISELKGRIAAESIYPYPPGIPIIMPGEKINEGCLDAFATFGVNGMKVVSGS